jgi:hypothetical protein
VAALALQRESKFEQLSKGQGTEVDYRAAAHASRRAVDAAHSIAERRNDYAHVLLDFSPNGIEDLKTAFSDPLVVPPPGYDPAIALAWLEATIGLKLEFVRFDELNLPFQAALRIREGRGSQQAGDLIVSMVGRRFESLDQAVMAQWEVTNGPRRGFPQAESIILSGGLAGHIAAMPSAKFWNVDYLQPAASHTRTEATIQFEARVRDDKSGDVNTVYVVGACVSLEGLVVVPLAAKSIVDGQLVVAYAPFKGTARVVASDDKHGITLVRLEAPNRQLFQWLKCRAALPTSGQRLETFNVESGRDTNATVSTVGQRYTPPFDGDDSFFISPFQRTPIGTPWMTINNELQGIVLAAAEDDQGYCCLPAVHIQRLLDKYHASTTTIRPSFQMHRLK